MPTESILALFEVRGFSNPEAVLSSPDIAPVTNTSPPIRSSLICMPNGSGILASQPWQPYPLRL
jgi:hypothetical protein